MIPVPRVSVKNSERYPSSPRAGILKRIRTMPTPGFRMSRSSARRGPSFSMTTPRYPSGQSIISSSYGSPLPIGPLPRNDPRPAHLELEPLAPHRFHENAEVQLAPARHRERLGVVRLLHPQGHVLLELPKQPIAQLPAGHELPLPSRERRIVHLEVHGDRGLLHRDAGEPLQIVGRRHRLPDLDADQARERHDVAGRGVLYLDPLQPVERK